MRQNTSRTPALTPLREALLLAAEAPSNADFYDLLCAAIDRANELSELELRAAECSAALDRLMAQMDRLTAAEATQRITEIRTGLGQ
jgi:hypothetical protein